MSAVIPASSMNEHSASASCSLPRQYISLMYHNVVSNDAALTGLSPSVTSYFVTEAQFRQQLELMTGRNCLTLDQIICGESADFSQAPCPLLHVTFDDGWAGSFELAVDILTEYEIPATVFVTTGLIDRPWFVSRQQLAQFPNSRLQIGSHTVTHRFLTELNDGELKDELVRSRETLEEICQSPITTISAPHGAINSRVKDAVAQAGYTHLFTSRPGRNLLQPQTTEIARVAIGQSTSDDQFQRFLHGNVSVEAWRSWGLGWPKRLLGRHGYHRLRSMLLGETANEKDMLDL